MSQPQPAEPKRSPKIPSLRERVTALESPGAFYVAPATLRRAPDLRAPADRAVAHHEPDPAPVAPGLSMRSAALLLAVLPGGASVNALKASATKFRYDYPMAWKAVLDGDPIRLALALERGGVPHLSGAEYQGAMDDTLADLARD